MILYQLNMARGFVMPLEDRRRWLRWVVLYLLLMAVAIALVLQFVVARSVFWRGQNKLVTEQELKLLRIHPEYSSIAEYKMALGKEVNGAIRDQESILKYGRAQVRIASILLSLMEPLPAGMELGAINYDGESRKVAFEVLIPASLKLEEKLTPPKLVAVWENNPLLSKSLTQIEMENSERTRMGGRDAMCWRFSAVVGGP